MAKNEQLLLFDGHALIYRAYHAFPELTTPDGKLVNAVYGFTRIVLNALERFEPEYVAVAFDHPQKTFRHEQYVEYKAHREEMPDDLKPQIEIIKEVVKTLNIPMFEQAGYEADDLIGTVAAQAPEQENGAALEVVITTGDKDILQLVNDYTTVWIPARGKYGKDLEYTSGMVQDKMGVTPEQIIELKALMGDSSDNIPGVKGIGKKTATKLLSAFPTIDQLYQEVDRIAASGEDHELLKGAVLKRLVDDRDNAFLSRELATINRQVPLELKIKDCRVSGYNKEAVIDLFDELGFKSLIGLLPADDFEIGIQNALL